MESGISKFFMSFWLGSFPTYMCRLSEGFEGPGDWGRLLGGIGGIFIIFKGISSYNHTISLKHERSGLVAV